MRTWRVLVIDDDIEWHERIQDLLKGPIVGSESEIEVVVESSFSQAIEVIERQRIDLVVLDIRLGGSAGPGQEEGLTTREQIHAARFVPIVFFTGLPQYAESFLNDPLIAVVAKGSDPDDLRDSVVDLLMSGAPEVQRALIAEMEEVIRAFMLEYVSPNWAQVFEGDSGKATLAHVLARRLATALSGNELSRMIRNMGLPAPANVADPLQYYVIPPIADGPMLGDLHYFEPASHEDLPSGWWIVLTPNCDFAQKKAEFALLAKCTQLDTFPEFAAVENKPGAGRRKKGALKSLLGNKALRNHHLPAAFDVPNLIVDFQDLVSIPTSSLGSASLRAALDSPYAEELQARFASYFGRIGTRDLDFDKIVQTVQGQGR